MRRIADTGATGPVARMLPFVLALAVGTAGGALFAWLRLPLAWMIGAMVFNTAAAMAGVPVRVPGWLRTLMIVVLGVMLGSTFRPELLHRLDEWTLTLAGLAVHLVVAGSLGMLYLRKVAGYDRVTAYFAAAPGGLTEMILAGTAMGGDERTISLSHALRIVLVVMAIPFWFRLFGGYEPGVQGALGPAIGALSAADALLLAACAVGVPIAAWLRLPAPALVGPMFLSAAIHLGGLTEGTPPGVLVGAAQVIVGSAIGGRFVGVRIGRILSTAAVSLGLTVLILAATVGAAAALQAATGLPLSSLVLSYAPGGLAEMSLVALALGIDPAFVATHHIVRIFLIVTLAPLAFRLLDRLLGPGGGARPD